jgi:hypothetical protein
MIETRCLHCLGHGWFEGNTPCSISFAIMYPYKVDICTHCNGRGTLLVKSDSIDQELYLDTIGA